MAKKRKEPDRFTSLRVVVKANMWTKGEDIPLAAKNVFEVFLNRSLANLAAEVIPYGIELQWKVEPGD